MFRYRMNSKPPRFGWVIVLFIIGLLLIILSGQLGGARTDNTTPPSTSNSASGQPGNTVQQLWGDLQAGVSSLWAKLTGADQAKQVDVNLDSIPAAGSGTDEEDTPTADDISVDITNPLTPDSFVPIGQSPQVLIYHTHSHEAYTKMEGQDYVEVAKWRTVNNSYNVAQVGEELAVMLSTKFGIAVLHDKTDNEYPKLGTSYSRSLKTVKKDMEVNKDLKILIDLHRDAYNTSIDPSTVTINGKKVARIMLVIGTGAGQTGVGFTDRPDYKKNLVLANAVTDKLNQFNSDLARKVSVKTGRYNQHLSTGCILIEVGHNKNTLEEALNAVPFLAQAIADVYNEMTETTAASPTGTSTPLPTVSPTPAPTATAAPTGKPSPTPSQPAPTGPAPQVITIEPVLSAITKPGAAKASF